MLKSSFEKFYKWLGTDSARKVIFAFFIVQVVYLIFSMRIGVPPDELTHIRFIEHYAENSLSPIISEQNNEYFLGDVTREISYLYHYLMSLLFRILPIPLLAKYVVFRFVGLGLSLVAMIYAYKTAKLLQIDSKLINLSLFVVANASEWLLMSAAINNDNAVWALSSVGVYLVLKLWKDRRVSLSGWLLPIFTIIIGSLVKKTFLPIAFVLGVVLLVLGWSRRREIKLSFSKLSPLAALLAIGVILGSVLVVERIGGNLLRYGAVEASCDQIHSVDNCLQYGVFRRNYNLTAKGAVADTALVEYAPFWVYKNTDRVFGPQAWTGDEPPAPWFTSLIIGLTSIGAFGVVVLSKKRWRRDGKMYLFVFLLSTGYVLVNLFVNYDVYQLYGVKGLALQGRYIFPIFPLLTLCILAGIFSLRPAQRMRKFQPILVLGFCAILLWQSGISRILSVDKFVSHKTHPVILYDSENAIGPWEPSI